MTAVGLTGGTGHLGSILLHRLLADPAVDSVVSVARRPLGLPGSGGAVSGGAVSGGAVSGLAVPGLADPRLTHVEADLRSPDARRALEGVDLCYHLGFQLWTGGGRAAMQDANMGGTANVLAARPGAVVFASSAAVYGAWPDNPLPLTEGHPARPNPEVAYAAHKLEAEVRCLDAAPTMVVRLAAVLGAHADAAVARSVAGYRLAVPAVRGVSQAVQFLDEVDAVDALLAAGRVVLAGSGGATVVNAATKDWLSAAEIAKVSGGRVLAVPRRLLLAASEAGRRARLLPFGADRAALVSGPLALDPSLAAEVLGWAPTRTSASVLREALGQAGERRS